MNSGSSFLPPLLQRRACDATETSEFIKRLHSRGNVAFMQAWRDCSNRVLRPVFAFDPPGGGTRTSAVPPGTAPENNELSACIVTGATPAATFYTSRFTAVSERSIRAMNVLGETPRNGMSTPVPILPAFLRDPTDFTLHLCPIMTEAAGCSMTAGMPRTPD